MGHKTKGKYQPIENYGIVGNLNTIALISNCGSIDYLPFIRIDSPTIFAAILDSENGGYFKISPVLEKLTHKQLYVPDTNILLTRFYSEEGIAEMEDFMPVKGLVENCALIRNIRVIKGQMKFKLECRPRFNYGQSKHRARKKDGILIFESDNSDDVNFRLLCSKGVDIKIENEDGVAEFTLKEKEQVDIALEAIAEKEKYMHSLDYYAKTSAHETIKFWRDWIGNCTYKGRWREVVYRSALTLKLLTSWKYGSIVAAGTFGLPEIIGGSKNWDYRYTWIRDASFTMYSFLRLGFTQEAKSFLNWITRLCVDMEDAKDLQIMYRIDGGKDIEESQLKHWEGYRESGPVRIGNAAYRQFQLDIYGELIDTIYVYNKMGGAITYEFWHTIQLLTEYVCANWEREDHGIWEFRNVKKEFLHTRMMCWVALDRAIKMAQHRSFPAPLDKWRKTRDDIFKDIYNNFWNEEKKAFVQYKGGDSLDATALLMPLMKIMSPKEPRWEATLKVIEKQLTTDTLVYRYSDPVGKEANQHIREGTFTMCSFWFVQCLAQIGEIDKARFYFEKMLGYANHLGLYSEEIGLQGELLGNFPQAFTHLALISAAYELDKAISEKERRK